ncbi:MAG TPA: hypothetical protein VE863_09175 [Pyrinomonadaceae bacterium]|nr:hypothetical protein [Pyrinomonadaceae bacterium]
MSSYLRTILLLSAAVVLANINAAAIVNAQTRTYPDTIRGYKVERTVIELKSSTSNKGKTGDVDAPIDQLITFGKPELARITPLGITFAVPIVVAPVTQSGKVDLLTFEDMEINGRPVNISDYEHSFQLPNTAPLTLKQPLRIYIYLSNALLAAIGEWTESKDTWPVTGHIYVFGKFKKGLFRFKRCVPVEMNLTMRNPFKEK